MVAKRFLSSSSYYYIMLSEATRSNLRDRKIKKFPGGACPQTPLDGRAYARTMLILSTCPPPPNIWALSVCPPWSKILK